MSAQLAQALQFIVSVVMVKQGDGAINTQNKLYSIEAVSGDEARGKAIPLAQADFPEHQFHTACFWQLEAAPQQEPAGYVTAIEEGKVLMLPHSSLNTDSLVPVYAAPQQAQAPGWQRSQHDADSAELRSLCAERDELRRWKSTCAPRLAALEGSLQHAQREAAQGMEARSALASEREANAILTDELEAQQAQDKLDVERYQWVRSVGGRSWTVIETAELASGNLYDSLVDAARKAPLPAAPQQGSKT